MNIDDDLMEITLICKFDKTHIYKTKVKCGDYLDYQTGDKRLIQDIFPYLSPDIREMFISGMCPVCWNELFSQPIE